MVRRHRGDFTWEGVDVLPYKEDGTHFKGVTRQVLLAAGGELAAEFRYFEIAPNGYSTLERHEHEHAVVVLRGSGRALISGEIEALRTHDALQIPALAWHQFRAGTDEPLGFLCVVAAKRDRPQQPTDEDLRRLRTDPAVAAFIQV